MSKKRALKKFIKTYPPEEYLKRYLSVSPLALALFRANEAAVVAKYKIESPTLDIGCGFGEFAGVFFDSQIEMGVDISWEELIQARKSNKYRKLLWADARSLPFPTNKYNSVISISVLEHITNPYLVIKEMYRVLKHKKHAIFTVNTSEINKYLYWPKKLEKIKLMSLAKKYPYYYHKVFKHESLLTVNEWLKMTQAAGFNIEASQQIISPDTTRLFDKHLMTAWPSQLIKIITGKRRVWRPQYFTNKAILQYSKYIEINSKKGSNLLIVAQKP